MIISRINQSRIHSFQRKWKFWKCASFRNYRSNLVIANVFISVAKITCKNIDKNTDKSLSCKYSQKRIDHAKQSTTVVVVVVVVVGAVVVVVVVVVLVVVVAVV